MVYDTATMAENRRIHTFFSGAQQAQRAWSAAAHQPSWITRITAMAFLIVIGIPIALLVLAALFVAAIVFGVLVGANLLWMRLRGFRPQRDGRENVRVIERRPPE